MGYFSFFFFFALRLLFPDSICRAGRVLNRDLTPRHYAGCSRTRGWFIRRARSTAADVGFADLNGLGGAANTRARAHTLTRRRIRIHRRVFPANLY